MCCFLNSSGIDHVQILEGKNCSYQCEGQVTPETSIFWESIPLGFYQDGPGLWISNISRNRTGEYDCMEKNKSTNQTKQLDSVFIDVICKLSEILKQK